MWSILRCCMWSILYVVSCAKRSSNYYCVSKVKAEFNSHLSDLKTAEVTRMFKTKMVVCIFRGAWTCCIGGLHWFPASVSPVGNWMNALTWMRQKVSVFMAPRSAVHRFKFTPTKPSIFCGSINKHLEARGWKSLVRLHGAWTHHETCIQPKGESY